MKYYTKAEQIRVVKSMMNRVGQLSEDLDLLSVHASVFKGPINDMVFSQVKKTEDIYSALERILEKMEKE